MQVLHMIAGSPGVCQESGAVRKKLATAGPGPANRPLDVGTVIDDFEDRRSGATWRPIDDRVMGGVSRSSVTANGRGTAVFAGEVSLQNNGGFASVRRFIQEGSLEGFHGVELRVRGDGKTYRLTVCCRRGFAADIYRGEVPTEAGKWTRARVGFAGMERSIRGCRPPDSPPIEPGNIKSIGLSIGDKQAGPFRLEIDWIRAYRDGPEASADRRIPRSMPRKTMP